jgi:putative nucleotidyltransferase with HDIG domain
MFEFIRRKRLIQKGMATQKIRRRRNRNEIGEFFENSLTGKIAVLGGFVVGLVALILYKAPGQPAEKFLTAFLIFLIAIAQLWVNHPNTFARNSRLLLIFGTLLIHLGITKSIILLANSGTLDPRFGPLVVPYAFAPLVCSVLLGRNHGLYAATFASLWGALVFRGIDAIFLVMSLICGFTAVFLTLEVRRRSRLLRAGFFVGLATWIVGLVFQQILVVWELFPAFNWKLLAHQSFAAVGTGFLTATLVGGIIPLLESLFGITTNITWLEAADLNHPLLKRMTIDAPGTYHHSLVVANLAEAGAEAVGANPTMTRVCSYFHDIGKLVKPEYFTENAQPGDDPHKELAPTMSALIVIAHVKEGIDLALKYKLSQPVIDVIQQHHGTTLVRYFYQRALRQQDDARRGGKIMNIRDEDIPEVKEQTFRYQGPKPKTREAGIIMLADAVESASRSLEKPTPQRLEQLIGEIVLDRITDGQLEECPLTMADLKTLSKRFQFTLQSMLHTRISYPPGTESAPRQAESRQAPTGTAL